MVDIFDNISCLLGSTHTFSSTLPGFEVLRFWVGRMETFKQPFLVRCTGLYRGTLYPAEWKIPKDFGNQVVNPSPLEVWEMCARNVGIHTNAIKKTLQDLTKHPQIVRLKSVKPSKVSLNILDVRWNGEGFSKNPFTGDSVFFFGCTGGDASLKQENVIKQL